MKKLLTLAVAASVFVGGIAYGQTGRFDDVPEGHYAEEAISWAVENGITSGVSPTEFGPDETLTRAQMVTFLHRYHENVAAPILNNVILSTSQILRCALQHNNHQTYTNIAILSSYVMQADIATLYQFRLAAWNRIIDQIRSDCQPPPGAQSYIDYCVAAAAEFRFADYQCSEGG